VKRNKHLLVASLAGAVSLCLGCDPRCEEEPGRVCNLVGTGIAGLGDNGLKPGDTDIYLPMDVQFGPDGRTYFTDWNNHRIRYISGDGLVQTLVGTGYLGDAPDGAAQDTSLNHPVHMSFAPNGDMIISAWHNSKVLRYSFGGDTVETICGTGERSFGGDGGPAIDALLDLPVATAFAPDGSMYIADQANQRIRLVALDGIIDTVVGTGEPGFAGDEGAALAAQINLPTGQSAPPSGRIVTDDEGNLFLADTGNHRVRKVAPDGTITTVAGNGERGFAGDGGEATLASLSRPNDVAVDAQGNLFIADTDNHCIRQVSPDGVMSTLAGQCGERGNEGDGELALEAFFNRPYGLEVSPAGHVYVADTHNQRIRVVYR
jgi:sugar lactone lactonase YvrE